MPGNKRMNLLADLFLTFAKIGCFTFGGGYAMIALIEDACVEKKKWITHDDMMNVTVVAESTPGPIAINCATFTGYRQAGLPGALAATVGMVLPSFLIIFGISLFMDNYLEVTWIAKAIQGIRIAVGLLILDAGIMMLKKMKKKQKKKLFPKVVVICAFLAMTAVNVFSLHVSSIVLMIFAAVAGIAVRAMAGTPAQPGGDAKLGGYVKPGAGAQPGGDVKPDAGAQPGGDVNPGTDAQSGGDMKPGRASGGKPERAEKMENCGTEGSDGEPNGDNREESDGKPSEDNREETRGCPEIECCSEGRRQI